MTDRIVVSGIGVIGPQALGRETILAAFPGPLPAVSGHRVAEVALEDYLPKGRVFRRVSGATRFALAAMALAVRDAAFPTESFGGECAGLVAAITHGSVPYSVRFHREMLLEGRMAASPLHFSESVPNAPAGNGAIAFHILGPVHTLIGEEPVGAQAIDLAASLLRTGRVERCLVVGTEEVSEVVAQAYAQIDRARRSGAARNGVPPFGEAAAALVLEMEGSAMGRGVMPHAVIAGWGLARHPTDAMDEGVAGLVRDVCSSTGHHPAATDHILVPTGRYRREAVRGCLAARGAAADPPIWVDLAPAVGNAAGASNLLQAAISAALIGAGKVKGPGLAVSTGITGTLSAMVLSRSERGRT